jgi:PST family polysaccharide transporter
LTEKVKNRNTYGGIFKALALFGGVKVIKILISIIRSKAIAMLIGPAGMGINSLLKSTTDTINHLTGCGLHTSAVRDVAKAYHENNQDRINTTITTLRGLVWFTGLLGGIIVLVFAGPLSQFAFGNRDYTAAFRILSIMMIFLQINVGQIALLQGCFHYKDLAKATLTGQILSLVLTLPLYYFFREKGIVPALLLASIIAVIRSIVFTRRVPYQKVKMSLKDYWKNGKEMLTLGIVISLGGQISNASSYLMNIIISRVGSVEAVGLYHAAMSMATSYVFLVLSAMTTDYVPRLSAIAGDDQEQIVAINKQIEMVLMIMSPLLVAFMVFAKEALLILYSSEFFAVKHLLELLMFAMFFRAISWCISYAFIARGDSKTFLMNECIIFVFSISLKYAGFYYGSFTGIGIAIILVYIIYTILMLVVSKRRFGFTLSSGFYKIAIPNFIICVLALTVSFLGGAHWWRYVIGTMILGGSVWFSYTELDKRIHIKDALMARVNKKKKDEQ